MAKSIRSVPDLVIFQCVVPSPGQISVTTRKMISGDPETKKIIHDAIDKFHKSTCVKFHERTTETDYIDIIPGM